MNNKKMKEKKKERNGQEPSFKFSLWEEPSRKGRR
jgi:hypothetical protein